MKEYKEKISAYLDDALSQDELDTLSTMNELSMEQEAGHRAGHESSQRVTLGLTSRYQLAGDVLRGQFSDASMLDVRLQVREALRDEKIDIASLDHRPEPAAENRLSMSGSGSLIGSWLSSSLYRPLSGLAVAVSVAMVTVFAINQEETVFNNSDNQVAGVPVVSTPVNAVTSTSVEVSTQSTPQGIRQTSQQVNPDLILNAYLAEHAEAVQNGVHNATNASWQVTKLPDGFTLKQSSERKSKGAESFHQVYSDGLSSVSVFIERGSKSHHRLDGAAAMGALNAYGTRFDEYFVTVMGEAPASAVMQIARSTEPVRK
jgi:negative regulator of sigma E activity